MIFIFFNLKTCCTTIPNTLHKKFQAYTYQYLIKFNLKKKTKKERGFTIPHIIIHYNSDLIKLPIAQKTFKLGIRGKIIFSP